MLHEWELSSRIHEEALDNITLPLLENREMSDKKKKIPNEGNILNMGSGDKISMTPCFHKNSGPTVTEVNTFEANIPLYFIPRYSVQYQKARQ